MALIRRARSGFSTQFLNAGTSFGGGMGNNGQLAEFIEGNNGGGFGGANVSVSPFGPSGQVSAIGNTVIPTIPVNSLSGVSLAALPISTPQLANEIEVRAQAIANELIKVAAQQSQVAASGRVFTRFDVGSDIIENQKTYVTTGLFSGNAATMSLVYTGSLQTAASKAYYYDVWNGTDTTSESQFAVTYGHRLGSGSSASGTLNDSPTRAIYSQYRLLLLNPGDTTFTFRDGTSSDSIYTINFNRARIKDKLDPGNWQMYLGQLNGSAVANNVHTGSNVKMATSPRYISLVDDSGDTQEALTLTTAGRVFNVVSGSLTEGVYNSSAPHYYGLAYPDMGILVLNGNVLNTSMSFNTVTGSNVAGDNAWKLYTSISGAIASYPTDRSFQARNEETVTSTHFFVRVKNGEYNFSNNPTFVTGSVGEFSQATFIGDPKTYITTVGMYSDRQELLAVAKLSQPIQKSFSNEALIKVKLDF
jgi:hypothetical protein